MSKFVHLHLHSEYSLLDGACRIKELVSRVKEMGQNAVAITDHGNMYATIDFYNECKKQGVKAIIGCEVYVAPRTRFDKVNKLDSSPYHLVLLCENNEGYKNLIKLVSAAYIEGFYNKPRVDIEILRKYSKGLICLSACLAGEVARRLSESDYASARKTALLYNEIFGQNNYFIEIQNQNFSEQNRIIPSQVRLSRDTGIPLVATNDVHYLQKADSKVQQILMCVATNTTINDSNAMRFPTDEFYLKSADEMSELFLNAPDAIENTVKIADRCDVSFEFGHTQLPKFYMENIENNVTFFNSICREGLIKRYGEGITDKIVERLDYEISVIVEMGYVDYFLIVWDFVRFAKHNDIPVGVGRGSGAGSLCAYAIGITGIDPIKYNLIFERFLNPERISMPDFDIDFCIEGRQRVIDYVVEKYGVDHVSQIITFGTLAARGAIRDVARAMALPYKVGDIAAKAVPQDMNMTIEKALKESDDLRSAYFNDSSVHELIDMAKRVEGMPRHASTHAAGIVITQNPVDTYVPLQKSDEQIVTQFPMTVLESLGLLKFDFLGLRNLTVINDTVKLIRKKEKDFSIEKISLDDKSVYQMLSKGHTQGVFQFESAGMKSTIMKLVPEEIEDLIAVISLYRPGPMDSIPKYIKNRHDKGKIRYNHPILEDILDVTYGCIVYQEQVMEICRKIAGYSYGRADIVRRAMSKKKSDVMARERQAFIYGEKNEDGSINCVGAVKNGVSEAIANEIFDEMTSFASYAFNKSHAAAYATISYQTAYLKCHYFSEYMSALMTSVLDNTGKLIEYINECKSSKIAVLNPDINESFENFIVAKDGIRFSLLAIKNLGKGFIKSIINEREKNGAYKNLYDFCSRLHGKDINSRAIEALIKCGALDSFPNNRREMMMSYTAVLTAIVEDSRQNLEGQIGLFGDESELSAMTEMSIQPLEEYPYLELLEMEKSSIGIYVSGHPLDEYSSLTKADKYHSSSKIIEKSKYKVDGFKDGTKVKMVAICTNKKILSTKSGDQMCFCSFEDLTGEIEGIVFPKIYEQVKNHLSSNKALDITGRISIKDDEDAKLIVEIIRPADMIVDDLSKKALCLRLNTTDLVMIDEIKALAQENMGETKLNFYFNDIKKLTALKDITGVKISNQLVEKLFDIVGNDNVAFK